MLNFVKLKGTENDVNELFSQKDLSEQSREMLGVLGVLGEVDNFDFTFSQVSQTHKLDNFDGASLKIKFDADDLPEQLEEILIGLLSEGNFQGMLVELGNGDAMLKVGYRNLPFADRGEDPGPDEPSEIALTDLSLNLFDL